MIVFFFLTYLAALSLPGLAAYRLFKLKTNHFIGVVAISYSVFTLSFVGGNYFGIKSTNLILFLGLLLSVFLIYLSIKKRPTIEKSSNIITPIISISLASLIYQLVVGPFNEVPADLYAHLERYQFALKNIHAGDLGLALKPLKLFRQGAGVFYHFLASLNFIAPISTSDLINVVDFGNRTIFLIASYFFTRSIFNRQSNSWAIASVATLFVFLHFGISVFAYSRYYTLAPTMLNMVLYMFGILSALHIFKDKFCLASAGHYAIIGLIVICASAIHVQEAMFILVMIGCFSACIVVTSLYSPIALPVIAIRQAWIIFIIALIAFFTAYAYSLENIARQPNAHWRLWDFGPGAWFTPQLTVLNLKKEFTQVVTLWGLLVYLLFFLNIRLYRHNLFIIAAMFSPLFTILNPFFVDLFLRHYNSTTLWRLCYLIPIHMVAADLFLHYIKQFKVNTGIYRIAYLVPPLLIALLLLPIENTWKNLHYSRAPSLQSTNYELSPEFYIDLLIYLNSIENSETILTDPMTGYMLSGMTKHYSPRRKFFRDRKFIRFSYYNYSNKPIDKHRGALLIVNLRPQSNSRVGALSNHWLPNQWLLTKSYYPAELLQHLSDRPDKFKLEWSENEIAVYRIQ